MTLANLSLLLGLGIAVPQAWQLLQPGSWREWSARFPRSRPIGTVLVLLATAWFVWHVRNETLADFTKFKPYLMYGFATIGILTCVYVTDFLGARGLALLLLLLGKLMVDTARWHPSDWRWVVTTLAYVWVIAGIWLTISPWRLRDFLQWQNAEDGRLRMLAVARLALALLLIVLGLTAYRVNVPPL